MKITKKIVTKYVRRQLGTNPTWAIKALVRIFTENQTESEQSMEATTLHNDIGFTGRDAKFLSSLAKQQISRGFLSDKQIAFVLRVMPKYSRQVIDFSDSKKLEGMVIKSLEKVSWRFSKIILDFL